MFDANRYDGLLPFRRRAIDGVGDFDPFDDAAERGKLAVEMRAVASTQSEVQKQDEAFRKLDAVLTPSRRPAVQRAAIRSLLPR